jgi:hypothetical protein
MVEVTFSLPETFELPKFYTTEDPEKIALALELGATAVEQLYKKAESTIREETHGQIVASVEAEFVPRLEKLKREKTSMEETIVRLKDQISALEIANTSWSTQLTTRAEQMMASTLEAKNQEIEGLKNMLRMVQDLGSKVERLGESFYKNSGNSSLKGRSGEVQVEEILKLSLDSEVYPVNKEAYSADHHLVRGKGKYKYLVDSKNYTRMLNQGEIDKLHRDLRVNADAVGALLISLNSGITGHSRAGDIDIEFNEHGKPIVYIGNLMRREEISVLFASLRPFFEAVERMADSRAQGPAHTAEHERLQQRATLVGSLVRSHLETMLKMKNMFVNNKKKMDSMYAEQYANVMQLEGQIRNLLAVALGDEEQTSRALQDSEMPLPSFLFRKTARTELVDKENKFVEWMERSFEFGEGGEVELKLFLERAVADGFTEKETRAMREKLFTEEAWAKQGRKLRGLALKV